MKNLKRMYMDVWFECLSCEDEFYKMCLEEVMKMLLILMMKEELK